MRVVMYQVLKSNVGVHAHHIVPQCRCLEVYTFISPAFYCIGRDLDNLS